MWTHSINVKKLYRGRKKFGLIEKTKKTYYSHLERAGVHFFVTFRLCSDYFTSRAVLSVQKSGLST